MATAPLGDTEVEAFRRDGFLGPLDVFPAGEIGEIRRRLEEFEATLPPGPVAPRDRRKLHIRLPWMHDLVSDSRLLDIMEPLLGSDILVYTSTFFINYFNKKGQLLTGPEGFTAAVQDGYFQVIAYSNTVTLAADGSLAKALKASHSYYLAQQAENDPKAKISQLEPMSRETSSSLPRSGGEGRGRGGCCRVAQGWKETVRDTEAIAAE